MPIAPFALERYFSRYEFSVPYLLCSSDCQSMTVADLLALEEGSGGSLQQLGLGYTEYDGDPALRSAIASLYDGLEARHVLVHTGAQEAIHNFMRAVLRPGDHAIVHAPGYQSLYSVAEDAGCEVTRWVAREDADWALDLDALEGLLRPTTRVVVTNAPHNPTGWAMAPAQAERLAALSRERGFIWFSDEVYRLSEHSADDRAPAACVLEPTAVSLGVMSKSLGLAGLRVGWIATRNAAVYEAMQRYKDYTTLCNSAPSELLAGIGIRQWEKLIARNVGLIKRNVGLASDFFARWADLFKWTAPRAGPIAFPRLREEDAEPFCDALVREEGVLLLPGTVYGAEYPRHFRMGFGRDNFPQALERFERFVARRAVSSAPAP